MFALLQQPMAKVTAHFADAHELQNQSYGPRIAVAIFGALVLAGAILTITRRNPVAAVMSLVGTFFGIAAMFAMLSAHFLAALQVLVYAGAIMVLFIFVVMVLNRDELDPWSWKSLWVRGPIAAVGIGYFMFRMWTHLSTVQAVKRDEPPPEYGTVVAVGTVLFTDYLFVFEAVSVVLLIAVVAAVVVARTGKHHEEPKAPEPAHDAGGH